MDSSNDQNPIQRLAEYLAENKASVVVGAGFSRNAIPIDAACPEIFPLWDDIASELYSRVYHLLNEDFQKGQDNLENELTPLEIASLFEFKFGRTELDNLIRKIIPDEKYRPGEAHTHLLSLPWKNVFTTNFDTLLDRANTDDLKDKYLLVENDNDFSKSGKEKIIKLHGSFTSDRPFIITQKDYETYVDDHNVFANKMKSALTENAFCLIGFSGKDPNFDDRTWWARFHLRDNCLPTYLVCLDKISAIKREFYKSRGITTIELNEDVVEAEQRKEKNSREDAILTFLKKLLDLVNAITFSKSEGTYDYRDLIPIYQSKIFYSTGKMIPDHIPLEASDLEKQYELWRSEREDYPGWVVAPKRYRSGLWAFTEQWVEPVLFNIEKVPSNFALFLLFELNWRLETTFCPLKSEWISIIDQIVQRFDFENNQEKKPFSSAILESPFTDDGTDTISDCLFSLHLSMARAARENLNIQRYYQEIDYLQQNLRDNPEKIQQLGYEKAIGAIFVFNEERVREYLQPDNWPLNVNKFPIFALRRAAIMAELGDLDKAEVIVRKAITILQLENDKIPPVQDISGYSQEAWGRLLLKVLNQNRWQGEPNQGEPSQDEIKRNARLELFGLNPNTECFELVSLLKSDPRNTLTTESKTIEYDPGHFTVRGRLVSFSSNLEFSELIPSYTMLKIFESAGLPYHCGMISLFKEGVLAATKYISQNSIGLSILSLLRTGDRDEILSRFSRMDIATMSEETVERLFSILEYSIPMARTILRKNESRISLYSILFAQRIIAIFPEILSRLSFRLSPEQLSIAYSLSLDLYQEPVIQNYYFLNESVKNILPRALFAMEPSSVLQKLPDLLTLPIPGYDRPVSSIPKKWIDPFEDSEWLEDITIKDGLNQEALARSIENLIKICAVKEGEARQRALLRLLRLYENKFLTDSQATEFGRVLWSQTDDKGIPVKTGLNIHELLDLPESETGGVKEFIKNSLLNANYQRYIVYGEKMRKFHGFSMDSLPWEIVTVSNMQLTFLPPYRRNRIEWTNEDIVILYNKIELHWVSLKDDLEKEKVSPVPFFRGQVDNQLDGIVRVLGDLILPAFLRMDRVDLAHRCEAILREIADFNILITPAYASLIQLEPRVAQEAEICIHKGLISENEEDVKKAHIGLYNWLITSLNHERAIPLPPQHLWDLISFELLLLRQPGLDNAIRLFCERLEHRIGEFPEYQRTMMVAALEKLRSETDSIGKDRNLQDRRLSGIKRIEVPYYRLLGAEFGCTLYRYFSEECLEIPPILKEMKREGTADILPEVRNVWRKIGSSSSI